MLKTYMAKYTRIPSGYMGQLGERSSSRFRSRSDMSVQRRDLIKYLRDNSFSLLREGKKHRSTPTAKGPFRSSNIDNSLSMFRPEGRNQVLRGLLLSG